MEPNTPDSTTPAPTPQAPARRPILRFGAEVLASIRRTALQPDELLDCARCGQRQPHQPTTPARISLVCMACGQATAAEEATNG